MGVNLTGGDGGRGGLGPHDCRTKTSQNGIKSGRRSVLSWPSSGKWTCSNKILMKRKEKLLNGTQVGKRGRFRGKGLKKGIPEKAIGKRDFKRSMQSPQKNGPLTLMHKRKEEMPIYRGRGGNPKKTEMFQALRVQS